MLKGKSVLITGGLGLLGRELVRGVLENHGRVIVGDINGLAGVDFEKEMQREFGRDQVVFSELDICSKSSILKTLAIAQETFGGIDSLVNNAYPRNKNYGRKFEDVEYQDFCENLSLHAGGYFLISQVCAEYFKKRGGGDLVFVSSIYGFLPPRFEIYQNCSFSMPVEYAVIKSGIIHLAKYIAKYYKGSNIRSNVLSPGGILNNQDENFIKNYNQMGLNKGMLDKKDLCGGLIFLLSDASKYVNGHNLVIDDGFSL